MTAIRGRQSGSNPVSADSLRKNGNIRGHGRRLSPIGALRLPIWESGDEFKRAKTADFRPNLAFPGELDQTPDCLAGAGGFEPPYGGIKIHCLTTWRRPNNLSGKRRTSLPANSLWQRRSIEGVEPFQQAGSGIRSESKPGFYRFEMRHFSTPSGPSCA